MGYPRDVGTRLPEHSGARSPARWPGPGPSGRWPAPRVAAS